MPGLGYLIGGNQPGAVGFGPAINQFSPGAIPAQRGARPIVNIGGFVPGVAAYSTPQIGGYGPYLQPRTIGAQAVGRGGAYQGFTLPGFAGPTLGISGKGQRGKPGQDVPDDEELNGLANYQFDPNVIKRELVRRGLLGNTVGPGQLQELYRLGAQISAQGGLSAYNQATTPVPQSVVEMLRQRSLIG